MLYCQLISARHLAEELLDQIQGATSEEIIRNLWKRDDLEEITRLWFLGWLVLFDAVSLLETSNDLLLLTKPYLDQARYLAMNSRVKSELEVFIWYVEGTLNHMLGNHFTAMNFHQRAITALNNVGQQFTPFYLGALVQRQIILDGPYVLEKHDLIEQIRRGRFYIDALEDNNVHERIALLEAVGRSLSVIQNSDCWQVLEAAMKNSHQGKALSGYLSALCSQMIAIINCPRQDKDQLHTIGSRALSIAESHGWKQRVERVRQIANQGGVTLNS